jgi:CubicO group peptidase (beta-lactamase class C family)
MQRDTLFRMASNTKAVTAAAVLALVGDGKLSLDDPVSRFLPSFADGVAAKITVQHLLTHTSGFAIGSLFVRPLMKPSDEHPDAPNLVLEAARFGGIGPKDGPGTVWRYSNPGYNTLAAIVEVVSDENFEAFCKRRFYEPLAMRDTCNHESRADHERMSAVVRKATDGSWRPVWQPGDAPDLPFVRGSGGMISTAEDYARFCRMWLDGGRVGDRRLLTEGVARAAITCQTGHLDKGRYGFGWTVAEDGSFAHGGSDGTWAWCDPERDLVGMVLTQTQGSKGLDGARRRFRDEVSAACPPR